MRWNAVAIAPCLTAPVERLTVTGLNVSLYAPGVAPLSVMLPATIERLDPRGPTSVALGRWPTGNPTTRTVNDPDGREAPDAEPAPNTASDTKRQTTPSGTRRARQPPAPP